MTAELQDPTEQPKDKQNEYEEFVAHVLEVCRSNRARANLRRGLGLPVERCSRAHRYLAPELSERLHRESRRAHYGIAALIAARPRVARDADDEAESAEAESPEGGGAEASAEVENADSRNPEVGRNEGELPASAAPEAAPAPIWRERPNLGVSFAHAVNAGAMKSASAENELHLLTRQSSSAIHERLPALTRQMLSAGVSIDWAVLLEDLSWWSRNQEKTATDWLVGYFRNLAHAESDDPDDDPDGESAPVDD